MDLEEIRKDSWDVETNEPHRLPIDFLEEGDMIVSIAVGPDHNVALSQKKQLYSWGLNVFGQLGLGDQRDRVEPTKIPIRIESVKQMRMSSNFPSVPGGSTYIVVGENAKDSTLFVTGENRFGQLGLGNHNHQHTLTRVDTLKNITDIWAGRFHAFAVAQHDGNFNGSRTALYGFGLNDHGQLGLGTRENHYVIPQRFVTIDTATIREIAAGWHHTLILFRNGSICAFGWNTYGQLGIEGLRHQEHVLVPTFLSNNFVGRVIRIRAANSFSAALTSNRWRNSGSNGSLYTWGMNSRGQLGLGHNSDVNRPSRVNLTMIPYMESILDIQLGSHHTLISANRWCYGIRFDTIVNDRNSACSGNGVCIAWNKCICEYGWSDLNCSDRWRLNLDEIHYVIVIYYCLFVTFLCSMATLWFCSQFCSVPISICIRKFEDGIEPNYVRMANSKDLVVAWFSQGFWKLFLLCYRKQMLNSLRDEKVTEDETTPLNLQRM
jgi:alpha-tubulin suppressor-like RCC1 family protein